MDLDLEEQVKYEKTQQQFDEIERTVRKQPLVSDQLPIAELLDNCGDAFAARMDEITKKYKGFRRVRPDGSCFYRGFCFALVEYLVKNDREEDALKLKTKCQECRKILIDLGYPNLTVEDFEENFIDILDIFVIDKTSKEDLETVILEDSRSNYFVVFMRLLVSAYIQSHSDDYAGLISTSLKVFCETEVEPVNREADSIHVATLALATGFNILVENCQPSGGPSSIIFPGLPGEEPTDAHIKLLYKPGHYDILY